MLKITISGILQVDTKWYKLNEVSGLPAVGQ